MEFLDEALAKYIEQHTDEEPALLKELNRETQLKVLMPRMISGHFQGRVISMLTKMIKPKNILEIGTYTGYSALCFAEGLVDGGKLITIDINEELEDLVRSYFNKSEYKNKIEYHLGDAAEIIPTLNDKFDILFIDADKENYSKYYDLVFDKVNKGGYIIADNVLWSGKVVGEKIDKDTRAILEFNKKVQDDIRVENVLFPIRDGLLIARKL
ncbi:MAG: O-methyltransferase [bacterium]|jgi:caffeoyl-CoA O-methyltransferase